MRFAVCSFCLVLLFACARDGVARHAVAHSGGATQSVCVRIDENPPLSSPPPKTNIDLPTLPLAILTATARQAAAAFGRDTASQPTEIKPLVGGDRSIYDHPELQFRWMLASVVVCVDAVTGKVVAVGDHNANRQVVADAAANKPTVISSEQATAATDAFAHRLPLQSGEWQNEETKFIPSKLQGSLPPSPAIWKVIKRRWVARSLVQRGFLTFDVSAYNGAILACDVEDTATLIPPVRPLVTRAQAETVALQTFGRVQLRPEDTFTLVRPLHPVWSTLNDATHLCRLTYIFGFDIPEIADPNPLADRDREDDLSPLPFHGHGAMRVRVEVDAETGQVISYGNLYGSTPLMTGGKAGLVPQPWKVQLFWLLAGQGKSDALTLAAMGAPALEGPWLPATHDLRFARFFGKSIVSFALSPKTNTLLWQTKQGQWAAVQLDAKSAAGLRREISSAVASH